MKNKKLFSCKKLPRKTTHNREYTIYHIIFSLVSITLLYYYIFNIKKQKLSF